MVSVKTLNKIQTYDDLEQFAKDKNLVLDVELSYRGGGVGVTGSSLARYLHISESYLPRKFGAGCNYLGGGVRGSIFPSGFSTDVSEKVCIFLVAFADACVRVYENIENESHMNDLEDENGETNWDAMATLGSRQAGIKSAY